MAARPSSSNSHSDGQSSASDLHSSIERSPHALTTVIPGRPPSDDGVASPPRPRPALPHHSSSLDSHRPSSSSAGRGGCWTCRLRRKKCDEEREDGNSCKTCRRLQLNCLGWGPRRPDWMRDKEAVANYKSEIKAHLLRLGLIRGQPRSSLTGSPGAASAAYPRASTGGGPPTHAGDGGYPYRYDDAQNIQLAFPTGMPSVPGNAPAPSSFGDPTFDYDLSVFGVPASGAGTPAQNAAAGLGHEVFGGHHSVNYDMRAMRLADADGSVRREHVAYYFTHVRGLQYLFTCKVALEAVHTTIIRDPQGALVNAICAISNLQYSTTQRANAFDAPREPYHDGSMAQYFYSQAAFQLEAARRNLQYSEEDALAAVYVVSYSIAASGGTMRAGAAEWMPFLEIACDWLTQTGLHVDDNPRLAVMNMSLCSAFCAKVTMCMDIFMSITLQQPPRLLALYRRLLLGGTVLYNGGSPSPSGSSPSGSSAPTYELYVPLLVGCSEPVLLALAEIAALAHWKHRETRNGTLSARELIMRGTAIERALRNHADTISSAAFHLVGPEGSATSMQNDFAQITPDMERRIVAAIFQETALLYLNTVLSGSNPGVPEISSSTNTIAQLVSQLPVGPTDTALVMPLAMAGCLADAPAARDTLKKRLLSISDGSANIRQIATVMTDVWARRDATQIPVEWREVMHERGLSLLLV